MFVKHIPGYMPQNYNQSQWSGKCRSQWPNSDINI